MVSGSNWYGSSSPIISTIFSARNAFWLFSANCNKLLGTSICCESSLYLKLEGKEKPSAIKVSAKAKSLAE